MKNGAIYRNKNIIITPTIVSISNTSYPVNGITAVYTQRQRIKFLLLIGSAVLLIFGLSSVYNGNWHGLVFILISILGILGAISRYYYLFLRTSAGDTQALRSKNRDFVTDVKSAIETAVALRG